MKNVEIEVKLLGVDREEVFSRLRELGIPVRKVDQEDFVVLLGDGKYLRVRTVDGKHILTYKRKLNEKGYSQYLELEVEVSDGEIMKSILKELFSGYFYLSIRKERWVFGIKGVKGEYVEVNNRVRYVELEGEKEDIERAIELLSLRGARRSTKPLDELLVEAGIKPERL